MADQPLGMAQCRHAARIMARIQRRKDGSIVIPRHGGDRQQNECKNVGIATVDAEQEHSRSLPKQSTEPWWRALTSEGRLTGLSVYRFIGLSSAPPMSEAKIKLRNGPRHGRECRRRTIPQAGADDPPAPPLRSRSDTFCPIPARFLLDSTTSPSDVCSAPIKRREGPGVEADQSGR